MKFVQKLFPLMLVLILLTGMLSACQRVVQDFSVDETPSGDSAVTTTTDTTTTTEKVTTTTAKTTKAPTKAPTKPTTKATTKATTEAPKPTKGEYKTEAELIIGKWTGSADMAPILAEQGLVTMDEPCIISATIEFTSNGTLLESVDKTSFSAVMRRVLNKALNDALTKEGMTQTDFEAQIGMTMDEYIESVIESLKSQLNIVSNYKFAGKTLLVKQQDASAFVETEYKFLSNDRLQINEDGHNIIYTRVK